jgi:hypothetical protein
MAHFAKLNENNEVVEVNVINNEDVQNLEYPESEPVGIAFLTEWSGGYTNWKQTSYNKKFRVNYAGVGGKYDEVNDVFIPPKKFTSWVLNENYQWVPPIPCPEPGEEWKYHWDEEIRNYVKDFEE